MHKNLQAFLDMIAVSEGTKDIGEDGYNVLVGSRAAMPILFGSYADHPRARIQLRADDKRTPRNEELTSTAAGRYQILVGNYDAYKKTLKLPDFSPASQDAIAVQLIRECRAYDDILAGRIAAAIKACRSRWASFPGAGYKQPEHSLERLTTAFTDHGGRLA